MVDQGERSISPESARGNVEQHHGRRRRRSLKRNSKFALGEEEGEEEWEEEEEKEEGEEENAGQQEGENGGTASADNEQKEGFERKQQGPDREFGEWVQTNGLTFLGTYHYNALWIACRVTCLVVPP